MLLVLVCAINLEELEITFSLKGCTSSHFRTHLSILMSSRIHLHMPTCTAQQIQCCCAGWFESLIFRGDGCNRTLMPSFTGLSAHPPTEGERDKTEPDSWADCQSFPLMVGHRHLIRSVQRYILDLFVGIMSEQRKRGYPADEDRDTQHFSFSNPR